MQGAVPVVHPDPEGLVEGEVAAVLAGRGVAAVPESDTEGEQHEREDRDGLTQYPTGIFHRQPQRDPIPMLTRRKPLLP